MITQDRVNKARAKASSSIYNKKAVKKVPIKRAVK